MRRSWIGCGAASPHKEATETERSGGHIGWKLALLGGLAAGTAALCCRPIRMPLREFTRSALYMAVLDDEICRNELEGNRVGTAAIRFPPRAESLYARYQLFLRLNREKTRDQLRAEIREMERRLQASRQYMGRPKERLEVALAEDGEA